MWLMGSSCDGPRGSSKMGSSALQSGDSSPELLVQLASDLPLFPRLSSGRSLSNKGDLISLVPSIYYFNLKSGMSDIQES